MQCAEARAELQFRAEPLDGPAGKRLTGAFHDEVAALYPLWTPSTGPSSEPQDFEPPAGCFFVLYANEQPAGCGGFKRLDDRTAEIKRMYVRPELRGHGLARRILERLEAGARVAGYAFVRLDTGDRQPDALHLYGSAGYQEIPDYNHNPAASYWFEKAL